MPTSTQSLRIITYVHVIAMNTRNNVIKDTWMPILENWDGGFTYIRMYVHLYNLYVRKYVCINESLLYCL